MALPLPSRIIATYFTLWTGGARITSVPTEYNQIYLFHAVPSSGGAFTFQYGGNVNAAEIKQCQARGQRVVLTVGGANAGFNFQTRAQSQAFVDSFKKMNDQLGGTLDGCDFNNFEAHVGSSPTEMTWISQQLKALYGSNFSISAPPAPGAGWAPMDRTLTAAMSKAGVMDYAAPQFYDSPDLTQLNTIVSLIDEWVVNMGDARKVVVGLTANYGAGPTLATCQEAWKRIVAKHPNIRGVFSWSAQDDARGGYNWVKAMSPLVGAKLVTDGGSTPSPAPAPAPTGDKYKGDWVKGKRYNLGDVVKFEGKYYEVYQVDSTGTSNGTQPVVSYWYWRETKAPATSTPAPAPTPAPSPAPAPSTGVKAGDRVKTADGIVGSVQSISGNDAVIKVETMTIAVSKLTKI